MNPRNLTSASPLSIKDLIGRQDLVFPAGIPHTISDARFQISFTGDRKIVFLEGRLECPHPTINQPDSLPPVFRFNELHIALTMTFDGKPMTDFILEFGAVTEIRLPPGYKPDHSNGVVDDVISISSKVEYVSEGQDSSWTISGKVSNVKLAHLYDLFAKDGSNDAIMDIMAGIHLDYICISYEYHKQLPGKLELDGKSEERGEKGDGGWFFKASAAAATDKEDPVGKEKVFKIATLLKDLVGDVSDLPEIVRSMEIPRSCLEVNLACSRVTSEETGENHAVFALTVTVTTKIGKFDVTLAQIRSYGGRNNKPDPKLEPGRLLRFSLSKMGNFDVPVVGNIGPPFDQVGIVWTNRDITPTEIEILNEHVFTHQHLLVQTPSSDTSSQGSDSNSKGRLQKGFHFQVALLEGSHPQLILDHVVNRKERNPEQNQKALTADDKPGTISQDGGKSVAPMAKTFGPLSVRNIGLSVSGPNYSAISLSLDAIVQLGPLAFTLLGFSITIDLSVISHPDDLASLITGVAVNGMAVEFDKPPTLIAGMVTQFRFSGQFGNGSDEPHLSWRSQGRRFTSQGRDVVRGRSGHQSIPVARGASYLRNGTQRPAQIRCACYSHGNIPQTSQRRRALQETVRKRVCRSRHRPLVCDRSFSRHVIATGELTPVSCILDQECKLTGSFAMAYFLPNSPHDGDFVFSVGGYHPHFRLPSHYPVVRNRVGITWKYDNNLFISGEAYFAITPHAVMGGGRLDMVFNKSLLGDALYIRAVLSAYADFLMHFHPFSFEINIGVSIYVSATVDTWLFTTHLEPLELSANMSLWGPPIAGIAKLHVWRWNVEVAFGPSFAKPNSLNLHQFVRIVKNLPAEESGEKEKEVPNHLISVIAGKLTTDGNTTTGPIEISAAGVVIQVQARLPILSAKISGSTETKKSIVQNSKGEGITPQLFARPMRLMKPFEKSELMVTLRRNKGEGDIVLDSNPLIQSMPPALWGEYIENPDVASLQAFTIPHVIGYTLSLHPAARSLENIPAVSVKEFNSVDVGKEKSNNIQPIKPVVEFADDECFQLASHIATEVENDRKGNGKKEKKKKKKDAFAAWDQFKRVCSGGGLGKDVQLGKIFTATRRNAIEHEA